MPLPLSSIAIEEKNRLASGSTFLIALEVTIPGIGEPIRVVDDSASLAWRGETWVAFPFSIEEIGDHAKGEVPQVEIRIGNVGGVMGHYLRQYDLYTKANGYSPIEVSVFVVNTRAIAPLTVSQLTRSGAVATATCAGHRYASGQRIHLAGAEQPGYNGTHAVTVVGADAFTFPVQGYPVSPATGAVTAQLASPEVEYRFELRQPKATRTWAVFTLGAANPFLRRFPQAMVLKNHCRYRFKGVRCGYGGEQTSCNHTLARCRELGNSPRFGGAPGAGHGGIVVG